MRRLSFGIIILLMFIASACDQNPTEQTDGAATPPLETATPVATVQPAGTPGVTDPITPTTKISRLTIWIPPEMMDRTELGTVVFSDQLLSFSGSRPELETRLEFKPVAGPGGILSYLRAGKSIAPSILPDLVALPTSQLAVAAAEGLIFPLDEYVDASMLSDLFPAAQALANSGERTIGYPFALTGLSHMAYNSTVVTSTIPLIWNQLAQDSQGQIIFPATGREGASLLLQYYLASGGGLTNDSGQPALQVEPLAQALEQLGQGRTSNFIALQSSNIKTLDESWQLFLSGTAVYARTNADQFLSQRTAELPPGFAPMPGPDGALTPLVEGWAWAIATSDPAERAAAVELLTLLVSAENLGKWSHDSRIAPARRQAFVSWPVEDTYTLFLQQELERAAKYPLADDSSIMTALSDALFDVISLIQTPQEAAEAAARAISP